MKRPWIILSIVLASGILLIALYNAQPKVIQNTPERIPPLRELVPPGTSTPRLPQTTDETDIPTMLRPSQLIRVTTERLLKEACAHGTDQCKAQAIYDFTRLNIEYTTRKSELPFIIPPAELLIYAKGDALDIALLMASMQRAAGFRSEIVRTPSGSMTWDRVYIGNTSIMIDPTTQGSSIMGSSVHLRGDELVFN